MKDKKKTDRGLYRFDYEQYCQKVITIETGMADCEYVAIQKG